jgi:hypothetical protein
MAWMDSRMDFHQVDLGSLHGFLKAMVICACAPEDVRLQFETAKNLMLYSWCVFEFHTVAEMHGYGTLELALRTRLPEAKRTFKRKGREITVPEDLRPLLRTAFEKGLINPAELPAWKRVQEDRETLPSIPGYTPLAPLTVEQWFQGVLDHLPDLRNGLAHGGRRLYLVASVKQLHLCADLINALYPDEASKTTGK